MLLDFVRLALKNITHRKRRSWLTIIGIFIGTAAVVALVSLGQGLDQSITGEFEAIGADKIFINPGASQTSTSRFSDSAAVLDADDLAAVRRVRGVADAEGMMTRSTRATFRGESSFLTVIGMPAGSDLVTESWNFEVGNGRMIRSVDRSNVVVGSTVAGTMFDREITVRSNIRVGGDDFRVVGILEPTGDPAFDQSVLLPFDRAVELFDTETNYDYIIVRVADGFDPNDVKDAVTRDLGQHRDTDPGDEDFTVSTPTDIIDSFRTILGIVQWVVVGIASISLLVGGVGIMNTMYTSVTERTREIGVMKAVGARNSHIMAIFLLESGMIGLVGGVIGVVLGLGLSTAAAAIATRYAGFEITVAASPELIIGTMIFAFVVGTASGVFPARNAAKLQPADALRYE